MKIKTAFFGSPTIAAELLNLLLAKNELDISLIITQPDKPMGKRLELTPTPVKSLAVERGIRVFDRNIRDEAARRDLIQIILDRQFDLGILYAYGALIPEKIIEIFPQGIWNVHPSLLPRYRGPSPTAYSLLLGDANTGVTLMSLVQKLDAGPIIGQSPISINQTVTRESLEKELTEKGSELISNAIGLISEKASVTTKIQDEPKSTYTRLLKKEDGYISTQLIVQALSDSQTKIEILPTIIEEYITKYDTNRTFSAQEIVWNMYRAFMPWPGIWTTIETNQGKKRLKINRITFKGNKIEIEEVQLEGKVPVDFKTFNKAYNFLSL